MNRKTFKSIWAILFGFVTVFVLSVATDVLLEVTGIFPPQNHPEAYVWWMLLVALIYRSIYSVIGFFITGIVAPSNPMRHALILGGIGTVFATLGAIANWKMTTGSEWYPLLLILVTFPCAWLGGKLAVKRRKKK